MLQVAQDGTPFVVCVDGGAQQVVCFWKRPTDAAWNRRAISGLLSAYYWGFSKFALSPGGILAVVYRGDVGTFLATSTARDPTQWATMLVSTQQAHTASESASAFCGPSEVLVQCGTNLRLDLGGQLISEPSFSGELQTMPTPAGTLIALSRSADGVMVSLSADSGHTWNLEWVPGPLFHTVTSASAAFDPAGQLSLLMRTNYQVRLYSRTANSAPWTQTNLGVGETAGPHQYFPDGKSGFVLSQGNAREPIFVTED